MQIKTRFFTTLYGFVAVFAITACAGGSLKELAAPMPDELPSLARLNVDWWYLLEDGIDASEFGHLNPTVVDQIAYVPLVDGKVTQLNEAGKIVKQTQLADGITAPLVVDEGQIFVLDREGHLTVYTLGFEKVWSINLSALATEAPLVTADRIFVQTIDGRVNAIERITGRLLWAYADGEPDLTITGTSAPVLINTTNGDAVVTGLSNGKVVALNASDGSTVWEYRIARASGTTDVSRLVDVDAKVSVIGDRLIAVGYQGDMVVIDNNSGRVTQVTPFSSYRSVISDGKRWYGVDAMSHVTAFEPSTLERLWTVTSFEYRQLSEILVDADELYVGDAEGYLHVLDAQTGEWLTSRHIDWKGSNSDPVKFGDSVLFQGYSSRIKSLSLKIK